MVFNRIDQDMRSFAGGGLLEPIYKPPLNSDLFFPPTSHFTTSSSRSASYPSSISSDLSHINASPTSDPSLFAHCGGQPFYDKPHSTAINMFNNYNFDFTAEDYQQWGATMNQYSINQSADQGTTFESLQVDPALQMQAMNNAAVAPQFQQNIQAAPVFAQEPIAQGIQNNVASDINFSAFEPVHLDANQLANIVSAGPAQVEQASNSDHNTEIATQYNDDVDAEGEPADSQGLTGFPTPVPMASDHAAALAHLSALPIDQLSQVIVQLQNSLRLRGIGMMPGEEMDIDQPEQIDGIPTFADAPVTQVNDIQNVQVQAQPAQNVQVPQPTQTANGPRPDIRSLPLPDLSDRDSRDQYLLDRRADGYTYREIKEAGGFKEAEATLRGRWRNLTKDPEHRLRKPVWKQHDVHLLRQVTYRWYRTNGLEIGEGRPPWKILAQEMFDEGASYHFGSGTVSKMWEDVLLSDNIHALAPSDTESDTESDADSDADSDA